MAWMAGRDAWQARCLREKSARNRRARGEDSLVRVLRRVRTVLPSVGGGEVAEGAIGLYLEESMVVVREIDFCFEPLAGSILEDHSSTLLVGFLRAQRYSIKLEL